MVCCTSQKKRKLPEAHTHRECLRMVAWDFRLEEQDENGLPTDMSQRHTCVGT